MPIDFAAIAARFAAAFATQLRSATVAQRALASPLGKRLAAGRAVELATREFPIVRFYNGAVTLWLEPGQRGALTLADPPPSVGQGIVRGGLGFLAGLRLAGEPLRDDSQETVLPRTLAGLDHVLAEIEASYRRFAKPGPRMFDPDRRTGSDLFGLAALAFRALAEASRKGGEIARLAGQVRRTRAGLGLPAAGPPSTGDATETAPALPLAERLDTAAYALTGAIAMVGSLPQLVAVLLEGLTVWLRATLLSTFAGIERLMVDLRADVYETAFVGLARLADRALRLVLGGYQVVAANVDYTLRFWLSFGEELALGIRDFVSQLTTYLDGWMRRLSAIPGWLTALVDFDVTRLAGWLGKILPSFSLSSLLDADGERVNLALRDLLLSAIDVVPAAAFLIPAVRRRVRAARQLVHALFPGPTLPPLTLGTAALLPRTLSFPAETAPLRFRSDFPDLAATLFGGGRADRLRGVLDRIEGGFRRGAGGALGTAVDGLEKLAGEFRRAAALAADPRAGGRLALIGPQSTELAAVVFRPEMERELAARRRQPVDPLAAAFEGWLAAGGFELIGDVIGGYVDGLAAHWRERQVAEDTEPTTVVTPTSPHLLRRNATVGRVVLPRLTVRAAPGRALDEELADAVAARFAVAVREAYAAGSQRLRDLAGAGRR